MAHCDSKTETCESSVSSHGGCSSGSCESKCECGGGCGGDPVACATIMWKCAFKTAMKEVMVDILKPRVQKMMGSSLEKSADAVLEAMAVKWQSTIAVEEAKAKLHDKLHSIMANNK